MLIVGGKKIFYEKNIYNSLIQLFGMNHRTLTLISNHLGIPQNLKFDRFYYFGNFQYKTDLYKFFTFAEKNLEALLKRKLNKNINFLIRINSYRGLRHKLGLPVRGQRTHTNGNTIQYLKRKKKVKNRYGRRNRKN